MSTHRKFRFPAYDDKTGAKWPEPEVVEQYENTTAGAQVVETIDTPKAVLKEEPQLYRRNEVHEAIKDKLLIDEEREEPAFVPIDTESAFKKREKAKAEKVEKDNRLDATDDTKEVVKDFTNKQDHTANLYRNEDGSIADIERLPRIKRHLQESREQLEDVPFRRKHNKKE